MTGNPCAEIDLSGIDQSPPAAPARAAGTMEGPILEALDAIDGLSLRHVSYRHDDHGRLSGVVTFSGWSPSLHAIPVEIPVFADTGGQDEVLFRIGVRLDLQRARAAHARSLGVTGPLRDIGYHVVDHLWTDRSLVAMRDGAPALQPLATRLASTVEQVHKMSVPHDGGRAHAIAAGVVAEIASAQSPTSGVLGGIARRAGRDVVRFGGTALEIAHDGSLTERRTLRQGVTTFDGLILAIPSGPLPETTLAALIGRTVGDLAGVHPLLDGRIIDHTRNAPDGKHVLVAPVPDLVRVRDTI